jgi:hypothetical protein
LNKDFNVSSLYVFKSFAFLLELSLLNVSSVIWFCSHSLVSSASITLSLCNLNKSLSLRFKSTFLRILKSRAFLTIDLISKCFSILYMPLTSILLLRWLLLEKQSCLSSQNLQLNKPLMSKTNRPYTYFFCLDRLSLSKKIMSF